MPRRLNRGLFFPVSARLDQEAVAMSRITKALEMAKADRAFLSIVEGPKNGPPHPARELKSEAPDHESGFFPPPVEVEFRQTRVVKVLKEDLLRNRIVALDQSSEAAECFNHLRTRLFQRTRLAGWNTVQITSFGVGEGKSTLAANLAVSIARDTRQTTLLVELDFRRPSLARLLGLGPECLGLKSYFFDQTPLQKLFVSPGIKKLAMLPAGGRVESPAELLGSSKMEALISELKRRYRDRYIIFDTPAISLCPDPLIISEYVDSVIMVARNGWTTRDSIRAAAEKIARDKFLGVLMNEAME